MIFSFYLWFSQEHLLYTSVLYLLSWPVVLCEIFYFVTLVTLSSLLSFLWFPAVLCIMVVIIYISCSIDVFFMLDMCWDLFHQWLIFNCVLFHPHIVLVSTSYSSGGLCYDLSSKLRLYLDKDLSKDKR